MLFFYVIICVYTRRKPLAMVLKNSSFCFIWRTRFKAHIWRSRPSPTLRPRNICIYPPCLSRSTQISRLCPFSSRWQAEWTPVQASCYFYVSDKCLSMYMVTSSATWSISQFCFRALSLAKLANWRTSKLTHWPAGALANWRSGKTGTSTLANWRFGKLALWRKQAGTLANWQTGTLAN